MHLENFKVSNFNVDEVIYQYTGNRDFFLLCAMIKEMEFKDILGTQFASDTQIKSGCAVTLPRTPVSGGTYIQLASVVRSINERSCLDRFVVSHSSFISFLSCIPDITDELRCYLSKYTINKK